MTLTLVVAVALLILASASLHLWSRRPTRRLRALNTIAEQAGLALSVEIIPALSRRLDARNRAMALGGAVGTVGFGAGLALTSGAAEGPALVPVLLCGTVLGSVIGMAAADSRAAFAPASEQEGPRLARSPAPTRVDYVGRFERVFTPVSLLLAVMMVSATGLLFGLGPAGTFDGARALALLGLPLALLTVSVVATVAGRFAISRLLDHGQPATSLTALAWDDAVRSLTVRSLSTTPGIIAVMAGWVCAVAPGMPPAGDGRNVVGIGLSFGVGLFGAVLVLLLIAASILLASTNTTQHYLRRLWPETAAQRELLRPSRIPQTTLVEVASHDPDA